MTFPKFAILHFCAFVFVGAAILYAFLVEPSWIDVTHHPLGQRGNLLPL